MFHFRYLLVTIAIDLSALPPFAKGDCPVRVTKHACYHGDLVDNSMSSYYHTIETGNKRSWLQSLSCACAQKAKAAGHMGFAIKLKVAYTHDLHGNSTHYPATCKSPLGMENNIIPDSNITASSIESLEDAASKARLNQTAKRRVGSWIAEGRQRDQWLQIRFESLMTINGIASQGAQKQECSVSNYTLSYSNNGLTFTHYEHGKVFSGSINHSEIVFNKLENSVTARYIRVHPKDWTNKICLRIELYGCISENASLSGRCNKSLGMENYDIKDNQISASSQFSFATRAENARLNFKAIPGPNGAWTARNQDTKEWLQVYFISLTRITGIATQGREDLNTWVQSYSLSFSLHGEVFCTYMHMNGTEFAGNINRNSVVRHELPYPITTHYLRIHPKKWKKKMSMRVEFYGCKINSDLFRQGDIGICWSYGDNEIPKEVLVQCPSESDSQCCEPSESCSWVLYNISSDTKGSNGSQPLLQSSNDKKLDGQLFSRTEVLSELECADLCFRQSHCDAYNLRVPEENETVHTCELIKGLEIASATSEKGWKYQIFDREHFRNKMFQRSCCAEL